MSNKLEVLVKDSGLDSTKAKVLLTQFQDYFDLAAEWEIKAKTISVTNENQTAEMKMARAGRLFLKEKRVSIEKTRKALKEQSLREGKAIDGIANVLKALIIPIEKHLDQQEHFVEIKAKEIEDKRLAEEARIAEEKRLADEKAEREEQERIRLENEQLRKEAEEKEKIIQEAQLKQKKLEGEKLEIEKKANEEKLKADAEIEELKSIASIKQPGLSEMTICPKCGYEFVR